MYAHLVSCPTCSWQTAHHANCPDDAFVLPAYVDGYDPKPAVYHTGSLPRHDRSFHDAYCPCSVCA